MTWIQPKTWSNEPLIAADMNTHIRDNLLALKHPPTQSHVLTSIVSTTSTSYVSISSDFEFTITTTGGDVMLGLFGRLYCGTGTGYFDIEVDGVDYFSNAGSGTYYGALHANILHQGFMALITGLSAGSHTFKFKFRITAGTFTINQGAQAWVREVS